LFYIEKFIVLSRFGDQSILLRATVQTELTIK
jgi:hypothetical protein